MSELVLIVDDNARNAKLARDVLEAAGIRTVVAASGAEALAAARAQMPDLVLLDLRLPDVDGDEVLRRFRADERLAHVPVVALSSIAAAGDDRWALDAGFDGFLAKPIDVPAFPGEVRRHAAIGRLAP
jgi:two-component system, cell cycle response regulator DivK